MSNPTSVTARIALTVTQPARLVFSGAVAQGTPTDRETLSITVDGTEVPATEVSSIAGTRLHVVDAPTGRLELAYAADVTGSAPTPAVTDAEAIEYTRPSRYCDSDRLANLSHTHFAGLTGFELMSAVTQWVRTKVIYRPGSSRVVDGALETYLSRAGVCRDSVHLVVAFLRGLNMPARLVSVYAPGLVPMDFHAVVEAYWNGTWYLLDATGLAPRTSMVRICTGRDAADTAFMTTLAGRTTLNRLTVNATVDGDLPYDDNFSFRTLT